MKLVEGTLINILNPIKDDIPSIHVGHVRENEAYPLCVIRRTFTDPDHVKGSSAVSESINVRLSFGSKESYLEAANWAASVETLFHSVYREAGLNFILVDIKKVDDEYLYDEVMKVHVVHSDYEVMIIKS